MKKLFTVDDLVVAAVSAPGYGLGFEIPKVLGYPEWLCGIICIVAGTVMFMLGNKIIFNENVQERTTYRLIAFAVMILIVLAAHHFSTTFMNMSMVDHVIEQWEFVIIPPLVVFIFGLVVRYYQIRKIRERYDDGSDGFVFEGAIEQSDIDEANRQNRIIQGGFDTDLAVKTKTGFFVGVKENDSILFSGIPYAKPPVGELRWKAPEPLPESEEVFEAKYPGASAIQVDYDGSILKHHRQSEDCLTLNICIGSDRTAQKKPVIVIFHHGDFSYGGSADPLLYSEDFTKVYPDTVGVTFNYRLGLLGFIDFSEVPGGENYPDALNLGLLDQIAALRWIHENISAFGGDPEKITVMGFESGAVSISLLAACEQAKGLFQKAFVFYGNPMASYDTPETSRNLAKKLLQETSTTTMAELMRLPEERLKEASQKLVMSFSAPTRDGKLIPLDALAAYRNGAAAGIDFIFGIPSNEVHIYKSFVGGEKYANFISKDLDYVLRYFDTASPAAAKAVRDYIKEQSAKMSELEAKAKIYDQLGVLGTYFSAKNLAESGNKVYMFHWRLKPLIEKLGSGTVDVLTTFLGSNKTAQIYGNVLNKDVAETLQNLFVKFQSGDELRLYNNELKGISAINWEEFPKALIVSEKGFKCEQIANRLTDVKCLFDFFNE